MTAIKDSVVFVTGGSRGIGCDYEQMHAYDPNFRLFTVSPQTWMVEYAMRYAIALATEGQVPSSTVVPQQNPERGLPGKRLFSFGCSGQLVDLN